MPRKEHSGPLKVIAEDQFSLPSVSDSEEEEKKEVRREKVSVSSGPKEEHKAPPKRTISNFGHEQRSNL